MLDVCLQRLSTYIEKAAKLKGQVKSAMVYPAVVIFVAVLVLGVPAVAGAQEYPYGPDQSPPGAAPSARSIASGRPRAASRRPTSRSRATATSRAS